MDKTGLHWAEDERAERAVFRRYATVATAVLTSLFSCAGGPRLLEKQTLPETALGREKEFAVLRAPEIGGRDPVGLPVVLLLHGVGDDHRSLDRHGVSEILRTGMMDGSIPLAHFILPDGERGFYVNWYDGTRPYEDYIIEDVLPAGEALLGVAPDRENRHIMGLSMGGQGAVHIGLNHPELFSSVSAFSTFLPNREEGRELLARPVLSRLIRADSVWGDGSDPEVAESMDPYGRVGTIPEHLSLRFYLATGDSDREDFIITMDRFHRYLVEEGVESEWHVFRGAHAWKWWGPLIGEALKAQLD